MRTALGLAPNTIEAYARALEEYLALCIRTEVVAIAATKEHVSWYVHDLMTRPNPRGEKITTLDSGVGLANATLHQRLTAIRLWYDGSVRIQRKACLGHRLQVC